MLIVAGSRGKTGAAAMSGLGALRAGAGLVTVASAASAIADNRRACAGADDRTAGGDAHGLDRAQCRLEKLAEGKTVIAMGPGLGRHPDIAMLVSSAMESFEQPMVLDADALVARSRRRAARSRAHAAPRRDGAPHRQTTAEVQHDRVGAARAFATTHGVTLVLKGQRTSWPSPMAACGSIPPARPRMGTGGTGDMLTGMIAGFLAQFPSQPDEAVAAAVYLHGLAGEIGARALGEKSLIATDILSTCRTPWEGVCDLPHRL